MVLGRIVREGTILSALALAAAGGILQRKQNGRVFSIIPVPVGKYKSWGAKRAAGLGPGGAIRRKFGLLIQGVSSADFGDGGANRVCLGVEIRRCIVDAGSNPIHLGDTEAAGRSAGRADADAAGDEGLLRVVGDGVFVDGDIDLVQPVLHLACR